MAEETQYTANTGWCSISTANANLDGTGAGLGTVLTGASNGTLIKSVMIKATTSTTEGMIRLFIDDGAGHINLIREIHVPAITKASINPAFEVKLVLNMTLKSGYILKASTQVANTFNVIAEGLDWTYYSNGVRTDTTQFTGNTGCASFSTANTNLDGTGSITIIYATGASNTFKGSSVKSITIKCADGTSSPGMVRLYMNDGVTTTRLFSEIFVTSEVHDAVDKSFEKTIVFDDDLDLKSGWNLYASTEITESFRITVEGYDWKYSL
ncbi:MAG TPA: hypothetical protein VN026_10370 [Bacteroidia bacterium]|jgi:hypothetical protein|nr:hypothetical protein [Bacteroidia bacterium]